MNKRILTIVVAVLLVGSAAIVYLASNQTDAPPVENTGPSPSASSTPTEMGTGKYVEYSESAIADAEGERVLFFHAPWCPQCRAIESDIEAQGVPAGYTIIKVDYDSHQSLRQKYGVTIQTTFVKVDAEGNFISRYVAYDEPTLDSVKENFL